MLVVVAYDVNTEDDAGARRLQKVAKKCMNYGQRVQNSVFECMVDAAQYRTMKEELCNLIDMHKDSLRFYKLGNSYKEKIEHFGAKSRYDPGGILMI